MSFHVRPVGPGPRTSPVGTGGHEHSAGHLQGSGHGLHRHRRALALVGSAVTLVLVGTLPAAQAATPEQRKRQVQSQLATTRQDLDEDSAALVAATSRVRRAEAKLPPARQALAQARGELVGAQARDAAAKARLAEAERALADAQDRVAAISRRITAQHDRMGQIAAGAYRGSGVSELGFALTNSTDPTALSDGLSAVQSVIRSENVVVTDMGDDRARLATERATLDGLRDLADRKRAEAATWLTRTQRLEAAAAEREAAVTQLVGERRAALAAARGAQAADLRRYQLLSTERNRIERLIKERIRRERARQVRLAKLRAARERAARERAARQRARELAAERAAERAAEARARRQAAAQHRAYTAKPRASTPKPRATGSSSRSSGRAAPVISGAPLSRPIYGAPITSPYGMRVHPITHVYKLHDGTDFGASCGTPIRAARSGTVVWTSYQVGYGNQTLIDHGWYNGRSLMTSYSHQSRFGTHAGAHVSVGEIIGYVGMTGYATGCHLHFMVYRDGSTVDPIGYL